jgi:hypothetical protein
MMKLLILCFPYFMDNSIAYDFFILKKNQQFFCNFDYDF